MKNLISILSMMLLIPAASYAQGEYDDLYYTPEDRETARKNYQAQVSQTNFKSSNIEDYEITTPAITSDRIYSTSQGRTVNPEYVAQYRSRADARRQSTQQDEEVYFDENYSAGYYEEDQDNGRVVNNYYYGDSWANPYYDPFYVDNWRWRYNDWRWRRAAWYHDPFWAYSPGVAVHVSIGFGNRWGGFYGHRWSRWSYDPWYSPYYAGGFYYDNFYNPYWSTPMYSNVYYNNAVYNNNNYLENNNRSVRRGPGTSRGSVISGRRSSVADAGPVNRVPIRRSSANDDTNGRVSSPATSGRVIDRTGAATRSPRSYDNVQDGYNSRTTRTGVQPATRSINTRSTTPVRGSSVERTRPTRGTYTAPSRRNTTSPTRTYTPSRSNNNREYTPSRSNTRPTPPARNNSRTTTPSRRGGNDQSTSPSRRRGGNDQSYTPSRSNSNSSGYSAPQQRSSQPSYNRSSSGSSSRSSSVTPSRSSSSSSGTTRSSSGSRSSSSRRGGN